MRSSSICLAVGMAVIGCGREPATESTAEPTAKTSAPAAPEPALFDAATTFKTLCATCHGVGGGGDGPAGAALNPKPAAFTEAAFWADKDRDHILKVIKEGGASVGKSPLMVAYGGLFSDEQIGQLADLVLGFKPAAAAEGEASPR